MLYVSQELKYTTNESFLYLLLTELKWYVTFYINLVL